MIHLAFPGFSGTPLQLSEAVRRGSLAARELPVLSLVEQALAQVEALELSQRSELLPLLAELILFKLRAFARVEPAPIEEDEADEAAGFLETLVALQEAIQFLRQRAEERSRVLPVPPPPLPKDRRLRPLPLERLLEAVRPFTRRAEIQMEPERFGLKEAWARLRDFLLRVRRALFGQLPLSTWAEQTVAFSALLEAHRVGEVRLRQSENFGALEVEFIAPEALPNPSQTRSGLQASAD
ncbi:hypothetical protein [Calidithermus timidus]|uniref:hypothetical protein n=1 Tax=Calidithermus timidus TaxID=307124 RepID=UPI00037E6B73|nr:hypothetical protein [Calidithermus timidus]